MSFQKVIVILMLCTVAIGFAQLDEGMVTPQLGSLRSLGMAGAYTATNHGLDALYGNPGGLAMLDNAQFSFGSKFTVLSKYDYEEDAYKNDSGGQPDRRYGLAPKITNIGIAAPIGFSSKSNIKLVGAVGYRSLYDIQSKEIAEWTIAEMGLDYNSKSTTITKGFLNQLTLGAGVLFSEKFSIGVSFGFPLFSGLKYDEEQEFTFNNNKGKDESEYKADLSGGTTFQIGVLTQLTSKFSLGFCYLIGHSFKFENQKEKITENGYTKVFQYKDEELVIPGLYSFGVSYKKSPTFLVTAELQNRPWEDIKYDGMSMGYFANNGNAYRLGFEIGHDVLFRGGFGLERMPLEDNDDDPVNIKVVTAGFGFKSNDMLIDVSAVYRFTSFKSYDDYDMLIRNFKVFANVKYNFDLNL